MATYEQVEEGDNRILRLEEQPIYGSDRLGLFKSYKLITYLGLVGETVGPNEILLTENTVIPEYEDKSYLLEPGVKATLASGFVFASEEGQGRLVIRPREYKEKMLTDPEGRPLAHDEVHNKSIGFRQYELKDHLGNVRAVISDRRTLEETADGIKYFQGELMSYNHYYPFGMDMTSWSSDNFDSYRYGFNGKEKDDKGEFGSTTHYDYGFRIYNPGIGGLFRNNIMLQSCISLSASSYL